MIGKNTIQMNEATMMAAVRCYFKEIFDANHVPKVVGVKPAKSGGGYGHENDFEITIEDTLEKEEKK